MKTVHIFLTAAVMIAAVGCGKKADSAGVITMTTSKSASCDSSIAETQGWAVDGFEGAVEEFAEGKIGNTIGFIASNVGWPFEDKNENIELLNHDGSLWMNRKTFWETFKEAAPIWGSTEHGMLVFRCIAETDAHYTVVVNETENTTKLVAKDRKLEFQTIEEHIVTGVYAMSTDYALNPVRNNPNDNAKIIFPLTEDEKWCFCTLSASEVQGEWIKVGVSDWETGEVNKVTGWIRWKKNDNWAIRMSYWVYH